MIRHLIFCFKILILFFVVCQKAVCTENDNIIHNMQLPQEKLSDTEEKINTMVDNGVLDAKTAKELKKYRAKTLNVILDTAWIKSYVKNSEPFTQDDLKKIFKCVYKLEKLITQKTSNHILQWNAEKLLRDIDLSSSDTLIRIVKETLHKLNETRAVSNDENLKEIFHQAFENIENATDKETTTTKEKEQIIALNQIIKVLLKNSEIKKIYQLHKPLELLQKHICWRIYDYAADELKEKLSKSLVSFLLKGGNNVHISLGFEVGAALAYTVKANVKLLFNLKISVKDHHQIEVKKALSFKAGALAGIVSEDEKLSLQLNISGTVAAGKGRVFANAHDFIDFHANDMLQQIINPGANIRKSIKRITAINKANNAHIDLLQTLNELRLHLTMLGVIKPEDQLIIKPEQHINFLTFKSRKCKGEAMAVFKATVGEGDINFGVGGSVACSSTKFCRYTHIMDARKKSPEVWREYIKHLFFDTGTEVYSGVGADQWLTGIMHGDDQKAIADTLLEAITKNANQLEAYCNVVNEYDNAKMFNTNKTNKKELARLKHCMEQKRILSAITTHVCLSNNLPDVDNKTLMHLQNLEQLFWSPPIHLSNKARKNKLSITSYCQSTKHELNADIRVDPSIPYIPAILSCDVRKEIVKNHYNEDMNGVYKSYIIKGEVGVRVSDIISFAQQLFLSEDDIDITDAYFEDSLPIDMSFPIVSGSITVHFQFIRPEGERKYVLQYGRIYFNRVLGGTTPEIPVAGTPAGDIRVKVEGKHSKSQVISETLGTNTLSYILRCYNGWATNGHASNDVKSMEETALIVDSMYCGDYWKNFLLKHEKSLKQILFNITDRKKNISQEFTKRLEKIAAYQKSHGDYDNKLHENVWSMMEIYKQEPSPSHYNNSLMMFNRFLASGQPLSIEAREKSFS